MEEKERYEMNDNDCIVDNEQNTIICDFCELTIFPEIVINLLNQQSNRIKDLEEQLSATERMRLENLDEGCKCVERDANKIEELQEESKQLKQSQKQLAISELEKLKENAYQSATDISCLLDYTELVKIIDNQIKKLGGGENE